MTKHQLSIFNQLRPLSIGFDNVFDHFESMLNEDFGLRTPTVNYPPYNIVETSKNKYDIEVALAGYNKKDIEVSLKMDSY
jgi:molecular chaperone IbpA